MGRYFERFIILDDIELFNTNSLNGLLRIIEEPSKNNYFILIYNKSKPLLETIKSRSLELKIILSETNRINIIKDLVNKHKLDIILDPNASQLSPGNFLKFNYIFKELDISINNNFISTTIKSKSFFKKYKELVFPTKTYIFN